MVHRPITPEPAPNVIVSLPGPAGPVEEVFTYLKKVAALSEMEVQKLLHDQWDIVTRSVQPVLWLLLFGGVFGRLRILPAGMGSYLDFVAPGILAQSVLTISIFQGIMVIWERDQGTLQKFLVSPMPRSVLVLGKGIGSGVKGAIQALTITMLALAMGVHINLNPLAWVGVIFTIFLGASFFSTVSLVIAALVRHRERVQGLGQLIMMPLFFASNALYPVTIMPPYVSTLASLNPLSYMVDALRELMVVGSQSHYGLLTNFGVLVLANLAIIALASKLYPRVVQ
jgi:ABC-2 type transport system permease protein